MLTFAYTAVESTSGKVCRGTLAGSTRAAALAEMKAQGWVPIALELETPHAVRQTGLGSSFRSESVALPSKTSLPADRRFRFKRGVRRNDLTRFTRQLATLVRSGMPLLRSLEVLARAERNAVLQSTIVSLADVISSGGNLSDGLEKHPTVFDALYVNMIRAGEAGGILHVVLDRLARLRERNERIRGRVKAAMAYPVIIMLMAIAILTGLMIFVVPKFEQIFSGLLKGQPLPPITRVVVGSGAFVGHHVVELVGMLTFGWLALRYVRRSSWGTCVVDRCVLRLPLVGDLVLKTMVARFTRTFGSLLSSGVAMLDALMITRKTSGNVWVGQALMTVHDRVRGGSTVAHSLAETAIFPGMVASMIEVGEETGALPEMLGRIADSYDEELDNSVTALSSVVEPVMIVLMAIVVGVIVVALFLPIVGVIQHLQ